MDEVGALAQTKLCERHLHEFVKGAWHVVEPATPFVDGWHIGCITEHLQAVTDGEIRDIVINMPPRHMKSLAISVFWFCWVWAKSPETRWLYASYAESLAARDSVKCRDVIRSPWYQNAWGGNFQIKDDENAKTRFANSRMGYRLATSVGGRAAGEGGDYIISDDPHKISEADSDLARQGVLEWWDHTMSTRGNDPKTVRRVVVMQRLHDKDLSGHVLAEKRGYAHLCIPCRFEPDRVVFTPLQKKHKHLQDHRKAAGELLWPERFGEKEIANLELTLGPWGSASQLQQHPVPAGGGIIKSSCLQYFTEEVLFAEGSDKPVVVFNLRQHDPATGNVVVKRVFADQCHWFQTCDTAMAVNQESHYTAIITFCKTPDGELLVYDVYRDRVEVAKQYGVLIGQRLKYKDRGLAFQAVESKAAGIGLLQQGRVNATPFRELKAEGDKVRRSGTIATMYENRMVYHKTGPDAHWLASFEAEILSFPNAEFDDQMDALSYGGILVVTDALLRCTIEIDGELLVYPAPMKDADEKDADAPKVHSERQRMLLDGFEHDGWGGGRTGWESF
jgi:predicted phage terminase large subunit-like protein